MECVENLPSMRNRLTVCFVLVAAFCFKAQAYGPDLSTFYGNFVFQNYTTNSITVDNLYLQLWDMSRGYVECVSGADLVQVHLSTGNCLGVISEDVLNGNFWVGDSSGNPQLFSFNLGVPALGAVVLAPGVCSTNCFYFNSPSTSDVFNVSVMGHLSMLAYFRTSGVNGEGVLTDGGYSMDLSSSPLVTYSCILRWGRPPVPVSLWCPIYARCYDTNGVAHSRLWKIFRR